MSHNKINSIKCEDTVQCLFFSSSQENVNWQELCQTLNETANSLSKDYIWHRDEFKICQPLIKSEYDIPSHLVSTTCFGDNIEDEWFITYLVFKLTEVHNDLIIQIEDNDGDFLLIEVADFLPTWANPETTQNRVFIYNNHVHLIPPSLAELQTPLGVNDALKLIVDHTEETKASFQIEKAIHERIGAYPHRIKELRHRATISLPVHIAALLILKPALISALVNTYCNHDIFDAKKCKKLKMDNCIDVSIQFTKFQYAMILQSKLPHNLGPKYVFLKNKKNEIGYKLCFGNEIIMNQSKKHKFSSSEYKKFLNNLKENNYFNGNIEGSKDYNQLLEKAQEYFIETESPVNSYVYENISNLMTSNEYEALKESLPQNNHLYLFEEDSDNWLNVSPDELDDLLNKNYRVQSDDLIKPSVVTSGLSNFLSKRSDYEGIEVNDDKHDENINIQFNSDQFVKSLKKMLDIVTINDSDEDCSDFSETEIQDELSVVEQQLDQELAAKMCHDNQANLSDDASILSNLISSMKEEGLSGPTSNIFKSIGIKKSEILDSDDDME